MNPQALHGPVRLTPEFLRLEVDVRFTILQKIRVAPVQKGTIDVWEWYVENNVLCIKKVEE